MGYRKGHEFHGIHYRTPGSYSYVKSDMRVFKTNGAQAIGIIGTCKGGVPGEVTIIEDPEEAKEVLKGGNLLDACLRAYDPVIETKDGVELGGADIIFAIRANKATKALSNVYQEKELGATIGEVVTTKHSTSTGSVTVQGAYTGEENKTFKIEITSEGTNELAKTTFSYKLAKDDKYIKQDLTANQVQELEDGVSITFSDGTYTMGDTFLIPCTAKVTESEFVYTIESKDYGEECNLIAHKLEDGEVKGTKRLTVYNGKLDEYEVFENLGGTFLIRYTGEQPYATISITPNGAGDSIKLQTFIGEDEANAIVDLDMDLDPTQYKTVKQLAFAIDGYENYEIEMVSTVNAELTVNDLDFLNKQPIGKDGLQLTAVLRDLKKTCQFQSDLVEVNIINREVSNYADYPFTNLTGGKEGHEPQSYLKYLDKLGLYDIDYIVPLTDDISILAECREHVIEMSNRYRKERRMVCGGDTGLSTGAVLQNAKKLRHERVQYMGTGGYDQFGKLYPPYIIAAQHAGRAAFLGVESATADIYKMTKPELEFSEPERKKLIDAGVLFFDIVPSDYNSKNSHCRLVWDYMTFNDYNDPLKVERSTGAIADFLSKKTRKELDKMLTGKLTPVAVLESARNRFLSVLKQAIKDGVIVGYKDVSVRKTEDKTYFNAAVAPTQVNNFTFIDFVFYPEDLEVKGE